jgi:hypothetical protein
MSTAAVALLTVVTLESHENPDAAQACKATLDRIAEARDRLSSALVRLHADLTVRIHKERPDLAAKLDPEPPKPLPTGYGLLPQLLPDEPEAGELPPSETRYSLTALADWVARECGAAGEVASQIELRLAPLDGVVDRYLVLRENLYRIGDHIGYHALWQPAAAGLANGQAGQERLARYRAWRERPDDPAARRALEEALLDFAPRAGLRIEDAPDGSRLLRVSLFTDIEDEAFLASFESGVERTWNDSLPMRAAKLRIDIRLQRRRPRDLYPEGAPARGSAIDPAAHLERFGRDGLVLTTGGSSTHISAGRALVLGPARTTPRTLAHEFAHLIGFADRYLRVVEGPLGGASGATLLEIVPFPTDLMASPGRGKVTAPMVRRLTESYGGEKPKANAPIDW